MPILVNNTGAGGAFEKVKIPPNNYKATLNDLRIEQKPDINNPGQMADTLPCGSTRIKHPDLAMPNRWASRESGSRKAGRGRPALEIKPEICSEVSGKTKYQSVLIFEAFMAAEK